MAVKAHQMIRSAVLLLEQFNRPRGPIYKPQFTILSKKSPLEPIQKLLWIRDGDN